VTKIGELGTTQAATSNRRTLRRNTNIQAIFENYVQTQQNHTASPLQRPTAQEYLAMLVLFRMRIMHMVPVAGELLMRKQMVVW
jgi:hypothetical protein